MYGKKHRSSWWLLNLSLPMMIGLFLVEMRLSLSETGHRVAEFIILLVVFGVISLWLSQHRGDDPGRSGEMAGSGSKASVRERIQVL
jgi:hypothetical protein